MSKILQVHVQIKYEVHSEGLSSTNTAAYTAALKGCHDSNIVHLSPCLRLPCCDKYIFIENVEDNTIKLKDHLFPLWCSLVKTCWCVELGSDLILLTEINVETLF